MVIPLEPALVMILSMSQPGWIRTPPFSFGLGSSNIWFPCSIAVRRARAIPAYLAIDFWSGTLHCPAHPARAFGLLDRT